MGKAKYPTTERTEIELVENTKVVDSVKMTVARAVDVPEIVVAFYTKNTQYDTWVGRFIEKCKEFGLQYDVQAYESRGNWLANCAIKPEFLKDMQIKYPNHRILYLDIDATICQRPDFSIMNGYDVAVYRETNGYLMSGTIFLEPTEGARCVIDEWEFVQRLQPFKADEQVLAVLLPKLAKDVKVLELDKTYLEFRNKKTDTVVYHYTSTNWASMLKIRENGDKKYILAPNKKAQQYLDNTMVRCGKLNWRPRTPNDKLLYDLRSITEHKTLVLSKKPITKPLNKNTIALCLTYQAQAIVFQNEPDQQFDPLTCKLVVTPRCKKNYPANSVYTLYPDNYEFACSTMAMVGILVRELQVTKVQTYDLTDTDIQFLNYGIAETLVNTFMPLKVMVDRLG